MPDLATHILSVYFGRYAKGVGRYFPALLIGAVLPDLARGVGAVMAPHFYWAWAALHTPFMLLPVCYLLSMCFQYRCRRGVFLAMYAGSLLHLALDLLQRHIGGASYIVGFPFTWKSFELGLFWPESSLLVMPFLVAGVVAFELIRRHRKETR